MILPCGHCGRDWSGELEGRKEKVGIRDFGRHQFLCLWDGVERDAPYLSERLVKGSLR